MLSVVGTVDLIVQAREFAEQRDYHSVVSLLSGIPLEWLKVDPELGHLLAQGYSQIDEPAQCAEILAELDLCCAQHGNDRLYRRRLNLRAVVSMRAGRLAEAEGLLYRVVDASIESSDYTFLATAMMNLGVVADMRCAWERAGSNYRHALVLFQRVGDRASMAGCYHNLGMLSRQCGQLQEAEQYFRRATENYKKTGTAEEGLATAMERALLASELGDTEQGAALAARCLNAASTMRNRRLIGEALRISALIHLRRNRLRRAYRDLVSGLRVERGAPNPMLRAELYEALAAVCKASATPSTEHTYRAEAIGVYETMGLYERAKRLGE